MVRMFLFLNVKMILQTFRDVKNKKNNFFLPGRIPCSFAKVTNYFVSSLEKSFLNNLDWSVVDFYEV